METPQSSKRRRLNGENESDDLSEISKKSFLSRPISPPSRRRAPPKPVQVSDEEAALRKSEPAHEDRVIPSPIRLVRVEGLSEANNIDTISLRDIVGNPLIRECWAFNYLIDVDFLLQHFDEDVRAQVKLNVVHGSWRKEDSNRERIEEAVSRHANVKSIRAWLPNQFGTHHSKMIVVFRHDDLAQVSIFTANLIPKDWSMCQAAWQSPLLPVSKTVKAEVTNQDPFPIGSGARFQRDLLAYLRSYEHRLKGLIDQLAQHDFSEIRAALVASVPGRQSIRSMDPDHETLLGLPCLKHTLKSIPCPSDPTQNPHINIQVSSIARLGVTDDWLQNSLFHTLQQSLDGPRDPRAKWAVIFPTPDEIRRSILGYGSGASIHMKIREPQQQKQLAYMRRFFYHWAGDKLDGTGETVKEAGRRRAAPHIKTYIRFSDASMTNIDWALVTSANLSKQAWGTESKNSTEVAISSYEIGVAVWPGLWGDKAKMIPVFMKDLPESNEHEESVTVGFRMPYDLPLVQYGREEEPWCTTDPSNEPDWMDQVWPGFRRA